MFLKISLSVLIVLAVLLVLSAAYIRLASHNLEKVHVAPDVASDEILTNGVKRQSEGDIFALHDVIMAEPRTKLLAGGPDTGLVTYVTRTAFWGFPDYTTVQTTQTGLNVYGRLRFGRSDFGVNAARVDRWINALPANSVKAVTGIGTETAG